MNIYDYITTEEAAYKTTKIPVAEGYEWNMYEHVRMSTLFRDSKFTAGNDDHSRPFKNIIRRIITLQHYATGFDVKDIEPFVDDSQNFHKSFLARKFHPKWARKHNLDTFIDELVESYVDFGLSLIKHVNKTSPEVVPLQSIAFVDQTDVLSGPICIKHQYSPAQLKDMEALGWGKESNGATITIDELITLARREKKNPNGVTTKTPGKFIEVYELDGTFPKEWIDDQDTTDDGEHTYTQQFALVAFYKDDNNEQKGVKLFHKKGDPDKYKALKRDPIFGRACGFGGIEELFEPQIWTNYNMIRIQGMLDVISKVLAASDDPNLKGQTLTDMDNGEIVGLSEGKQLTTLDIKAINIQLFERALVAWEEHAQGIGSANDAALGESPSAGTPFKLQELVTYQGKGPHEYRKGKVATFLGEVYRDWILSDLAKEMNNEQEFVETLSLEEMQYVADCVIRNEVNDNIKRKMISGQVPDPEAVKLLVQTKTEAFMKAGNKRFFKLLKDELKRLPLDVEVNIAGKQKNLSAMADKLGNVWSRIFANPQGFVQTMQIPGASTAFNEMMEASGLSPWNFGAMNPDAFKEEPAPEEQEDNSPSPTMEEQLALTQ